MKRGVHPVVAVLAVVTAGLAVRGVLLAAGVVFRLASGPVAGLVLGVALVLLGLAGLVRPLPQPVRASQPPRRRPAARAPDSRCEQRSRAA